MPSTMKKVGLTSSTAAAMERPMLTTTMVATMAMAGCCVGVVNAGGVMAICCCQQEGFVAERGGHRRHRPPCKPMPLNTHEFRPGNASFKNRAMLSHVQMMPACDSMARFLKVGRIHSRQCARAAPEGGRHYALWRNWQVGRLCAMDGALLKRREGFGSAQKMCTMAGPKNKKPDRPSLLRKKKYECPPY